MLKRDIGATRAILLGSGWFGDDRAAVFEGPDSIMTLAGGRCVIDSGEGGSEVTAPLELLEEKIKEGSYGVGFFGYEFFHRLQPDFEARAREPACFPDACFAFFGDGSLKRVPAERLLSGAGEHALKNCDGLRRTMEPESFMSMVEAVRRYIQIGDVYQVNISQMFEFQPEPDPFELLKSLYSTQPVPFACSMDFGDFGIASGSMELFLRKSGRTITTGPIKGTRSRLNQADDERIREELRSDEKERAENVMIVDLMRNDLGRICEFGSVRVQKLFSVETYATLHQLVSYVSGNLRDDVSIGDMVRATFPPGSVTGAPKRRALEIIEELEPHRRGPYCGAICLFLPGGDFVMSVGIRVAGFGGGRGYFWSGGGITWGSVPQSEYEETLVKARAVTRAIGGGQA